MLTSVDGRDGLNNEDVRFTYSIDHGNTFAEPVEVQRPGDRGYYSAPAISPDGANVWLVYNAWLEDFKDSAEGPDNDRPLAGVVLHAYWSGAEPGAFTGVHAGESGDARGSSQNDLAAEFLGDYIYAAATNTYGAAVWNDVRNAADCPAVVEYRQELHEEAVATGTQTAEPEEPRGDEERMHAPKEEEDEEPAPPVQQVCEPNFGNSDIYGRSYANPAQ